MPYSGQTCWIVSDGRRGMENQALGIAEALAQRLPGLTLVTKVIHPRAPWRWLPESLFGRPWPLPFLALGRDSDPLTPPWPDLLIACGRKTVAYSVAIRRLSGRKTFVVQTQDPRLAPRYFDLVVPPRHDDLRGDNVFSVLGSPNRIRPDALAEAADTFGPLLSTLPRPLVGVLIGGSSRHYTLGEAKAQEITGTLKGLLAQGYGLAVTPSRRSPQDIVEQMKRDLAGPQTYFWDGTSDNPYFGLLALCDYLLVTEESTNMLTEAAVTGKPVYMIRLDGHSEKFAKLHEDLEAAGIARWFEGSLEPWTYKPLRETERVADHILALLGARQGWDLSAMRSGLAAADRDG